MPSQLAAVRGSDKALLALLLVNLLFLRYMREAVPALSAVPMTVFTVVACIAGARGIVRNSQFLILRRILLPLLPLLLIVLINFSLRGVKLVGVGNVLTALLPVAAIVYFAHLTCQYSNDALARVVAVVSQVLNVYFVVNSAIVYVQISSQRFLMEPFLAHNPNAFDHMDGLIGSNGASVLNFVWLATFGLNVTRIVRRQGHPALPIVVVIQLGVMADISTKNDNKMFIPMFAVFGIVLLYFVGKSSCVTGRMKGAVGASLAVLATIVISANGFLSNSGSSYRPVDNSSYVEIILPSSTVPDARNERAYLNYVAYRDYHAASLGAGLSNVDDQKQRIHVHLGINSGSLLLIQGGVIYLAGLIALMVAALVTVTVARNRIRAGDVMSIGLLILITTFASQMFRDQFSSVAIGLFFVAISTLDGQPGVEGEVRQEARSN